MSEEKKYRREHPIQEMSVEEKLDRLHWFVTAMPWYEIDDRRYFHKEIVESLQAQLIKEVSDE